MGKHQITGRINEAKGAMKEAVGKLVGDRGLQARGIAQKFAGRVEAKAGRLRQAAK
ncbi:MAG: CsbD family protein [Burkholderiaceae bacterium]|nr:MAG: CsbD family protein [Burkholderiaceae bacterium]